MKKRTNYLMILLFPSVLVTFGTISLANAAFDDWPQWRGASLDSVSNETGLLSEIEIEENLLWKLELPGPGGASPVVWNHNIFLTTVVGGDNGDALELWCVSTDGQLNWKKRLDGKNQSTRDNGNSASPSPCCDGEHVWATTGVGIVQCFDMDGNQVWSKDLQEEYGEFKIQFGMASTPVLNRGRLYFQLIHGELKRGSRETSVGWVVALDGKTGDEIWKHERKTDGVFENRHSYASPTVYHDAEREFLVSHGGDYVIGHSLKDGTELWRCGDMNPKGDGYNNFLRFVSSPVCVEGMLVVPTAKSGPVLALKVDSQLSGDVTEKKQTRHWRLERGTPDVASPLVFDKLVYLARENGVLICLDAVTGETIYEERLLADRHRSTPVAADGKIFIADRKGNLIVLKAGRMPEVLSTMALNEETLASPAISNGRVFVRTQKHLYAFGEKPSANYPKKVQEMEYAIAIHGGAGSSPSRFSKAANTKRRASMKKALQIGTDILKSGGSSLDAVERVCLFLENDPQFNSGVGAVFNAAGSHELDASIMDGSDKACGAVAGVSRVKNPIQLARLVMTDTPHVLLAGQGAEKFALEKGVAMVEPSHFDTEATLKSWKKMRAKVGDFSSKADFEKLIILDEDTGSYMGTVGCVALDKNGNLAAATTTGGLSNKKFGRIGDSPIVGAGTFADNNSCAVSGTGIGEQYIRNAVAYDISAQMVYKGATLAEAIDDNLTHRLNKGDGGLIGVDHEGNICMAFNTQGMSRAAADSSGRFEVLWDEDVVYKDETNQ